MRPPLPPCRRPTTLALAVAAMAVAGCAGTKVGEREPRAASPAAAAWGDRDGPPSDPPPANLESRPDAEPRVEAIRTGGANKPYQVFGRDYLPLTRDVPYVEKGLASWYGRKFHGRPTAIGETYDMYAMTAAHPTLPLPSYARIRNPANGREVIVRVNDRGPFHPGRIVDLSYAAAARLGLLRGVAPVELERLTHAEIRAGVWRRGELPSSLVSVGASSAELAAADAISAAPAATTAAADTAPAIGPAGSSGAGFWLQLGAFRERESAEDLRRRAAVEAFLPGLATLEEAALYRVHAGPWPSRDQARQAAQRVRDALGLAPLVVERR